MGFFGKIRNLFARKKAPALKLGLALGSGGAKGMAHLGALKAFEEEGIRFQIVTGTSIGSIAGALYAKGYTAEDMTQVLQNLNIKEFSKNLKPFADMAFAERFLETYLEGDISSLSLPFAAWATDTETNEGVLLNEGKIARVLCASSAMPPFFRAVKIGDKRRRVYQRDSRRYLQRDGRGFCDRLRFIRIYAARRGKGNVFPLARFGDQRVCFASYQRIQQNARL